LRWEYVIIPRLVNVTPDRGTVGTVVTLQGGGYKANELVQIDFGTTKTITTVSATAEGSWTVSFTIDTQRYGSTTIKAIGMNSKGEADNLEVFIQPNIIKVTPTSGTVGSLVTVSGNGYGASHGIAIKFGTTATIPAVTTSTVYGSWTAVFTVDTQPYGTTTIIAQDNVETGAIDDEVRFKIQPNIWYVSPTEGTVGTVITIAGNGYFSAFWVRIDFGVTDNILGELLST
ncbi:MAG: hypothetical protein QME49_10100, partial [bacterium]|nr:hypothetical protein [bacterium]